MNTSPNISVGIAERDILSFRLSGKFTVDNSMQCLFDHSTASIVGGKIQVISSGQTLVFEKELIFYPCSLSADYFEISDVVIGVDFHWEQKESQRFRGALKLLINDQGILAINIVPIELYLSSVISSEMSPHSSVELLKAHAIISRSWLMAQINKSKVQNEKTGKTAIEKDNEEELIRWFDREDHSDFHVCADDHCQRYQGITKVSNRQAVQAVNETNGQVLTYNGGICDARYSKCCGGITELFESCWEKVSHPYLQAFRDVDNDELRPLPDFRVEHHVEDFITDTPDAFCNTDDPLILQQVLNDFDLKTSQFFRWKVKYQQDELASLIKERSGIDFGQIKELLALERGKSGRIIRLKIKGSKRTMIIGKELLIRKWLSTSHLLSAAFIIKTEGKSSSPSSFTLIGAGWGHGVGLCQIGAAVMGEKGFSHIEILNHYYRGAEIQKMYS